MSIMEQIKALEDRIAKAIEMIKALRAENAQLRTNLSNAKIREEELESIVSSLKSGNDEVENELANAITFSFSAPQEDTLNIQLGPDDNAPGKDQLNIF